MTFVGITYSGMGPSKGPEEKTTTDCIKCFFLLITMNS